MGMRVMARLAKTAYEYGWPVYAVTAEGRVYLACLTGKCFTEYEVTEATACIAVLKLVGSSLLFTFYARG